MDEQRHHQIFASIRYQANATDAVAGEKGQGGEGMSRAMLAAIGYQWPMLPDLLRLVLCSMTRVPVVPHRARWPDQQVRRSQVSCPSCRVPRASERALFYG